MGLWIAYESAPTTVQNNVGRLLLIGGAVCSIVLYAVFFWVISRQKPASPVSALPPTTTPVQERKDVWFFQPGICVSLNRSGCAVRVALWIFATVRMELVHMRLDLRDTNNGKYITCENSEPMTVEKLSPATKIIEQKITQQEVDGFVRGSLYQVSGTAKFRDGDNLLTYRVEINTIPSV
jgi:hypothetical protein